ncbi:MAG TPA: class I SAM-dependent RNA methyltransferase [Blastocatellia bacterium]|jgi:23S rRNA (uracil1939-C5)-methyltransferase|nr:class I SAM-dependent RNA methyltransferase [Blastocatellia bacterium]
MTEKSPAVGDVIELETERLSYGGDAVARHEGLAVFIPLAAPGERLRVRIVERKKNFARGVIEEIIEPAPERREPPCRYFGSCGGCQLQHLSYSAQLKAKAASVGEALKRIGKIDWPGDIEIRSSDELGYRTRAQVKIERAARSGKVSGARIGFNRAGSHAVIDVERCPILTPELNSVLASLRSDFNGPARSESEFAKFPPSEIELAAGDLEVGSSPLIPQAPAETLVRTIGRERYTFGPSTFFQVNRFLLEELVGEAVGEEFGRLAIDLYAGVGLFTIPLARSFDRVIGVESDPRASAFARLNVSENHVSNVEFHNHRTGDWLRSFAAKSGEKSYDLPDLVVLDPPRAGAAEAILPLIESRPERISYVSCDPTTLARDLRRLLDAGYELKGVKAFDLFPQTYHVETVVRLQRA